MKGHRLGYDKAKQLFKDGRYVQSWWAIRNDKNSLMRKSSFDEWSSFIVRVIAMEAE